MGKVTIKNYTQNGYEYFSIDNDHLKLSFIPSLGGKMAELNSKKTGTQFLQEPQSQYKTASYGDPFENYDTSGFDECFPTIEDTHFSINGSEEQEEIFLPDHGELWSRPWNYDVDGDRVKLSIQGVRLDYEFSKEISLHDNKIQISYSVKNNADFGFAYLWSAHPLLNVQPGNQVYLADPIEEVFLNGTSDEKLGDYGDILPWPFLDNETNYSEVQQKKLNSAVKVFTHRLKKGCAGIYKPKTDESLVYHFDTNEIPFLGIWLCYGGWPDHTDNKHLTVGLEPTNGRPDSVQKAKDRKECPFLEAGATDTWTLTIDIIQGKPDFENCNLFSTDN
ncbi:MAG TPA: hypothetical protein VKA34_00395 [Balneolales bacterium]|nr:hypothetical protein [Balneolales bacterium]